MTNQPTMPPGDLPPELIAWLRGGERGISSNAIAEQLAGLPRGTMNGRVGGVQDWPRDPDDFRRCWLLLNQVPGYRDRIAEMGSRSPEWAALAACWPELEDLLVAALPTGQGAILYRRMQAIVKESRHDGS